MISRLPQNILHRIAREKLLSGDSKSWFGQILLLCNKYGIPHPLTLLDNPPKKEQFKSTIKLKIADFWQSHYRNRSADLTSLRYFKPQFMSLLHPHPILSTAFHAYDINKMVVQLRMLSGRYRVGSLLKHFSASHNGDCELCGLELEDLSHLLVPRCPHLLERKALLVEYARSVLSSSEVCLSIFTNILDNGKEDEQVQLFLDCSAIPCVISANQDDKTVIPLLFRVTRTWCYSLHRTRLKLLNRWTQ